MYQEGISESLQRGPAYRIETKRLLLRAPDPKDAEAFHRAVLKNLDHLRPWMSWTRHEPRELAGHRARLQELRRYFQEGKDFVYTFFSSSDQQLLGAMGLQTRQGPFARELSFWIDQDYCGQGLTTEGASALVRVAFEVDQVHRVELHCDPENRGSAHIARRLGFEHEATLRDRRFYPSKRDPKDTMIWTLFRQDYLSSDARHTWLRAYDRHGYRLI